MKPYAHPSLKDVPLALVMQALSDPCRLFIVRTLLLARNQEMACNEIPLEVVKATRSHHFAVLREAGLAFTRMDGTKCMTSIREAEVNRRFPGLLDLVTGKRKTRRPAISRKMAVIPPRRRATSRRRHGR